MKRSARGNVGSLGRGNLNLLAWKLTIQLEKVEWRRKKMDLEYEQFLRDLEENPEMRFNISLYRNKEYQPSEMAPMTDREDLPSVPLEELLADLDLSDEEDGEISMRE
ncbi:nonsense-mediated mRNA decay NMD3 family protein [Actinidia rufa]|uniref:Nonsense-mediated mRNA decay NMD3 family protein n=1 Tax=Actinidia rufa TaxID=165716 RepID=A0A7J0F5Z5_9ERIC|nr:nonsense-mediated mRNA decay NMD3 family protein [Actinidia rufa]